MLDQVAAEVPFVDLDGEYYKVVGEFDKRFPEGAPSMKKATSLRGRGRLDLRPGVQVVGDVRLETDSAQRVGGPDRLLRRLGQPAEGDAVGKVWRMPDSVEQPRRVAARIRPPIDPMAAYPQPLMEALGLACAEDVARPVSLPAFDNSAMDGYAVRFADVSTASPEDPVVLPVVGEIGAGQARAARARARHRRQDHDRRAGAGGRRHHRPLS